MHLLQPVDMLGVNIRKYVRFKYYQWGFLLVLLLGDNLPQTMV